MKSLNFRDQFKQRYHNRLAIETLKRLLPAGVTVTVVQTNVYSIERLDLLALGPKGVMDLRSGMKASGFMFDREADSGSDQYLAIYMKICA